MTTTIIWAPHPDDETLYTAGYVNYCRNRGDELILVAVTNGGSSSAKPATWTTADLVLVRQAEQTRSWGLLTGNYGRIIRMNLVDGSVVKDRVNALATGLEDVHFNNDVEHYVCGHANSVHPDHIATALGVKEAGVRIVRGTLAPSEFTVTTPTAYTPSVDDQGRVADAAASYKAFGMVSVAGEFAKLASNQYTTKVKYY